MVRPASVSRRQERPSRIAVSRRSGKSRPPQSAAWLHGRVVSRSASPPPGRTDEPGQLTLSLPVWPGAPCVCWPTRRCWRVGRRPVGANWPNFCGTLGRCRRRPESGDPKQNPSSVWRLGSCGTWHLPAAAVALRCQVAHSPDRKPARPLPTLGGVEPQTAGQRPLLALTAQRPRRSFLWVDDRAAGVPTPLAHVGVPPAFPPARWIGWHPRPTELRSTPSSNSTQAPSAAPNAAETGRRLPPPGSLLPLRVPGVQGTYCSWTRTTRPLAL